MSASRRAARPSRVWYPSRASESRAYLHSTRAPACGPAGPPARPPPSRRPLHRTPCLVGLRHPATQMPAKFRRANTGQRVVKTWGAGQGVVKRGTPVRRRIPTKHGLGWPPAKRSSDTGELQVGRRVKPPSKGCEAPGKHRSGTGQTHWPNTGQSAGQCLCGGRRGAPGAARGG